MVKNPPSNAGDAGSIPGQGTKIPHATGQLSLRAATTEPVHSGAHTPQLESLHVATTEPVRSRARTPQPERSPRASMKIPCAATKTQSSRIKQTNKQKKTKTNEVVGNYSQAEVQQMTLLPPASCSFPSRHRS